MLPDKAVRAAAAKIGLTSSPTATTYFETLRARMIKVDAPTIASTKEHLLVGRMGT